MTRIELKERIEQSFGVTPTIYDPLDEYGRLIVSVSGADLDEVKEFIAQLSARLPMGVWIEAV